MICTCARLLKQCFKRNKFTSVVKMKSSRVSDANSIGPNSRAQKRKEKENCVGSEPTPY